jgi:CBS domain-containing protein
MRNTIMTEKIARRGVEVPNEFISDFLANLKISQIASASLTQLAADETIQSVRDRLSSNQPGYTHQGYPIAGPDGMLLGVLTLRDFHDVRTTGHTLIGDLIRRPPITLFPDSSLREAANEMIRHDVGRLIIVNRANPRLAIGIITRSDLLRAQRSILNEMIPAESTIPWLRRKSQNGNPQ